jgi:hypothetical protein
MILFDEPENGARIGQDRVGKATAKDIEVLEGLEPVRGAGRACISAAG